MNNETKHTPGPWKVGNKRDGLYCVRAGYTNLGNPLDTYPVANAFSKHNAEFIALAPETAAERDRLREALLLIAQSKDFKGGTWPGELQSIAKAALSVQPSPTQRVRDAGPSALEVLTVAMATIERLQRHAPGSANSTLDVIRAAIAREQNA